MHLIRLFSLLSLAKDTTWAHPVDEFSFPNNGNVQDVSLLKARDQGPLGCRTYICEEPQCGGDSNTPNKCNNPLPGGFHCPCKPNDPANGVNISALYLIPVGFFVAPWVVGVPTPVNPSKCPPFQSNKCSLCKAKDAYCTSGSNSGCPCKEQCGIGDNMPKCSEDTCQGDEKTKACTVGPQTGCQCKEECPSGDDMLSCADEDCAGNDKDECTKGDPANCQCRACPTGNQTPLCNATSSTNPEEEDCNGNDDHKCTTGKYKGCGCGIVATPVGPSMPLGFWEAQITWLNAWKNAPLKPSTDTTNITCPNITNTAIDANQFVLARDAFCKGTSKEYTGNITVAFMKGEGDCPANYCNDTLNAMWDKCGDYHTRKDNVPGGLDAQRGPLRGSGVAHGTCGTYIFNVTEAEEPTTGGDGSGGNSKLGPTTPNASTECPGLSIIRSDMHDAIVSFCADKKNTKLKKGQATSNTPPGGFVYSGNVDEPLEPIWYRAYAEWNLTCQAENGESEISVWQPYPDHNCEWILDSTWDGSNNGGRGGYRTVNCITYHTAPQCDPSWKDPKTKLETTNGIPLGNIVQYETTNCQTDRHLKDVEAAVDKFCSKHANDVMKAGDNPMDNSDRKPDNSINFDAIWYNTTVSWEPGCVRHDGYNVGDPTGPGDLWDCKSLLTSTFQQTGNGGKGGWRQVGCLRVGVKPTCGYHMTDNSNP